MGTPSRRDAEESGAVDVDRFRAERRAQPLRRYDRLARSGGDGARAVAKADEILERGWTLGKVPPLLLRSPIAWAGEGPVRSWWFRLNALDPLAPLLGAHDQTAEERFLLPAAAVAVDWAQAHASLETDNPYAWYDMAVGLRAYRMGYVLDAAARSSGVADDDISALLASVLLHAEALADDASFAGHSNHGLYQAAGQLALAARFPSLPGMAAARRQATERLHGVVERHFTSEGVHREHSPGYHWLVQRTLTAIVRSDLVDDDALLERLDRIEEALAWFVQPDRHLVAFGDTSRRRGGGGRARQAGNETLRFALSAGRDGRPAAEEARAFPESGYFVVRHPWDEKPRRSSYLALNAAFHSRIHKHADDLSFVWFDRGRELLVDAGPYGYVGKVEPGSQLWQEGFWYSHPNRVYVESTRSHNTVEIDGRSYPRRVEPYGSAITRWVSAGGVHAVEAAVRHFGTIEHTRVLVFRPGRWLLVADWLDDDTGARHDLAQRFHFAPELEVDADGTSLAARVGKGERLFGLPLAPVDGMDHVRGRREPDLLGWVSRRTGEMTPCWSAAYRVAGVATHTFATLLAFGTHRPVAAEPGARDERDGVTRWGWVADDGTVEVMLDRRPGHMDVGVSLVPSTTRPSRREGDGGNGRTT